MASLPPDYDEDPERWASRDRSWLLRGDTHEVVAARLLGDGITSVLDLGSGDGRLRELLSDSMAWVGVEASPTQLAACPYRPLVKGDAARLPFPDAAFDSVAALWMLYHLDDPRAAIRESHRALRRGGLFVACTSARNSDPELCDGYPPTTFDAEEAAAIVGSVFGREDLEVERWDGPFARLPDRDAVERFLRSHLLPADAANRVTPPVTLTKRGCLVYARKR